MSQTSNTDMSRHGLAPARVLPGGIDCVYFLMWPGWKNELRSNRWNYATRWSRVAPVVLVQPDLPPSQGGEGVCEPEPRMRNCRILRIERQDSGSPLMMLNQLEQIAADMEAHGYRRPLLWLYNAKLLGAFCALPAVARVVHATENHFEYFPVPNELLEQLKPCLRWSDLAVAVSTGVAGGIAAHVPEANVIVVSNGCDYHSYAAGKPDAELTDLRQGYAKLAIYAGNINLRIDFDLLLGCAQRFPNTLFILVGPVTGSAGSNPLEEPDRSMWQRILQQPNCRYLGPVDPDRLPDLYAAADVGIIPYKDLRVIRESGFALKALEMLASGLPVVSTLMRPLVGLCEALAVTDSASEFHESLETLCRSTLSQQAQAQMAALCRANDYDEKFRRVFDKLADMLGPAAPEKSHLAPFRAELRRNLLRFEEEKQRLVAEFQSLQAVYAEDRQNLVGEIQRLQKAYGEQAQWYTGQIKSHGEQLLQLRKDVEQRDAEVQRLNTVYGEAVRERNVEIERLNVELRYFRRFRTAARRIPGVPPLLKLLAPLLASRANRRLR